MTNPVGKRRNDTQSYIVKSATRAQIKAARMLLAREKKGLSSPSEKARAVAELAPSEPSAEPD